MKKLKVKKSISSEGKKRFRESINRFVDAETIKQLFFDEEMPLQIPISTYLNFLLNTFNNETEKTKTSNT